MIDIDKLRALLARKEGRHWYPRNRFISLVPDNSGMGATLPTNHIANFVDKETCELASEAVNALPQLLAIAEAAMVWRHSMVEVTPGCYVDSDDGNVDQGLESKPARNALIAAVDAARKAGT